MIKNKCILKCDLELSILIRQQSSRTQLSAKVLCSWGQCCYSLFCVLVLHSLWVIVLHPYFLEDVVVSQPLFCVLCFWRIQLSVIVLHLTFLKDAVVHVELDLFPGPVPKGGPTSPLHPQAVQLAGGHQVSDEGLHVFLHCADLRQGPGPPVWPPLCPLVILPIWPLCDKVKEHVNGCWFYSYDQNKIKFWFNYFLFSSCVN